MNLNCTQNGFTLLEMLVATAVFAMIAATAYGIIIPVGNGFRDLQEVRDTAQTSYLLSRRLRLDMNAIHRPNNATTTLLLLKADNRGGQSFDEVVLLTAEPERATLTHVRYYMDDKSDPAVLIRESQPALVAKDSTKEPLSWRIGVVESFSVEMMDAQGQWVNRWESKGKQGKLPKAIRITLRDNQGERELMFPVFVDMQI
ncbi:MAG: type II secretion system protein GspJ [Mariprofundales bacterium]